MDYTHNDYTVAWVCALPLEMTAAKTMLDKIHPSLPQPETDHNTYILGNIASHNVVMACLPSGVYGTTSAATVLAYMLSTFRSLRFGLMVGVGGGVPSETADIRLGDVVVSIPTPASGGVIQYDYGKTLRDGRLHRTGSLNKPPRCLLTAVSHIRSDFMMRDSITKKNIIEVLGKQQKANKQFSKPDYDCLFDPSYDHVDTGKTADCLLCDQSQQVLRTERHADEPAIHYGLIASGNQVIKDARTRDSIAHGLNILCFEMEAAGLMDQLPCLIVRGVCDYCDSHKNKEWQGYAALTAAVYTATLLAVVPSVNDKARQEEKTEFTAEETACLQNLFITDPADDRSALRRRKGDRAPGTCNWILETDELKNWLRPHEGSDEGSHSTMAITLTEELPKKAYFAGRNVFLTYFFCDSSSEVHRTALSILRGLLYQLIREHPKLIKEKVFRSFDALWSGVYCIIDALDECDYASQRMILDQIDQTFTARHLKDDTLSKIHLLITSRPFPEIPSYREEKIDDLREKKSYSKAVAAEVSRILKDKAEGTFLWVGIACDEIAQVQSRNALKILYSLPRAIESDDENDQKIIIDMLSIVTISRRRMTLTELCEACQICPNADEESRLQFTREYIDLCRLMVVISGEHVQLLHKSVRDFLVRHTRKIDDLRANATLAYRCINSVLHGCQSGVGEISSDTKQGFLNYSILYWTEHAGISGAQFTVAPEHEKFFLVQSDSWEKWLQHYNSLQGAFQPKLDASYSTLHVAARWGIVNLAAYVLTKMKGFEIDDTACKATAAANEESGKQIVALLLRRLGEQVQLTEDVLKAAASNSGNGRQVMELLLSQKGDLLIISRDLVEIAALNFWNGKDVIELLLVQREHQLRITQEATALIHTRGKRVAELLISDASAHILNPKALLEDVARDQRNEDFPKIQLKQDKPDVQAGERLKAVQEGEINKSNVVGPLYGERHGTQGMGPSIQLFPTLVHGASLWIFFLTAASVIFFYIA
ncbi:hypothetical protein BDV38DRAFT_290249 [Aspergillus pseudotamarii]|uniref:Uncharacterized protein n=1 Tax=Aspergillus pseudotamarii TaxID=132259 RepID=A0A5N6T2M4_ASPPS|nr:uncharacterized protein BDV38DRAFT_290249 [Aspergillus pseudotamarii]KAE8140550.1 hypothetical protein BDV38DRAFT_290249 [Aspergillus pseudotamarii]